MFARILRFINQPYPDRDDINTIFSTALIVGLVVFGVLFVLKPFGIAQAGDQLMLYSFYFGLISASVSLLFDLSIRFLFGIRRDTSQWVMWKWMAEVSALILCISLANYVFIASSIQHEFSFRIFFKVIYFTALVGVFPTILFGGYNLLRHLKIHQRIAAEIHPQPEMPAKVTMVELPVNKSTKIFSVDAAAIYYLEAMQNYVKICYNDHGVIKNEVLRNTITALESLLSGTDIKRCHRSFLVNKKRIKSVTGNAQGLKLELEGIEGIHIPVSRKYIPIFR